MNDHEITLVRESFTKLRPMAEHAAEIFYDRLFELDDSLRPMFPPDPDGQRLMKMIAATVDHLSDHDPMTPATRQLGVEHKTFGVTLRDYTTLNEAFFWTLEQCLEDDCTPELLDAWTKTCRMVDAIMQEAAQAA